MAQAAAGNGVTFFDAEEIALTAGELADIGVALAAIEVQGDRYPAHLQQNVGR